MKQLFLITLALLFFGIQTTHAQSRATIFVTSKSDGEDVNPGDGDCSDSNGDCGLRAAVMEANALEGADEITLINPNLAEEWNIFEQIEVTDSVTISGASPAITRIDAQNLGRIFSVVSSRLTLENMTLKNGNAGISNGGAIITNNSSSNGLNLTNVVIRDSNANNGGAIFALVPFMTIHNSLIEDNTATAATGGVRNVLSGSTTIMSGTTIRNNTAGTNDGGLALSTGLLETMTISGNSAGSNGGGIRLFNGGTLTQVTISGNSADSDGGGLILGSSGNMNLLNVTITDNSAGGDGGGVHSSGTTITMRNSILASNIDTSAGNTPDCFATSLVSEGYNVIGYINGACNHSGDTANDRFNTTLPALDPEIGPLQFNDHDNDGDDDPFETHVPNAGSPAVNLGNPDGCRTNAVPLLSLITEDQRGADRHQQGRCDAGAAESPHGIPTAVGISQQSTGSSEQWMGVVLIGLLVVTVGMSWRRRPTN